VCISEFGGVASTSSECLVFHERTLLFGKKVLSQEQRNGLQTSLATIDAGPFSDSERETVAQTGGASRETNDTNGIRDAAQKGRYAQPVG